MDVQCHQHASAYIDDIGIFSSSWEEHLDHLRDVFTRLRAANLKAKAKKCQLAMEEGHYLGHRVGRGRIHLEQAKVEAIATFNKPKMKKDIRALFSALPATIGGSFRDLPPAGLSDQLKKEKPNTIQWTPELESDFNTLRKELCKKPILACPDEDKPFILQTDASDKGCVEPRGQPGSGETSRVLLKETAAEGAKLFNSGERVFGFGQCFKAL